MTLSRSPSPQDLFNNARRKIFCEHGTLRAELMSALAVSDAAARGDAAAVEQLPSAVIQALVGLKSHLGFEEAVLVPILSATGAAGRAYADALLQQHREQRARLHRVVERAGAGESSALRAELRGAVEEVFAEMADEERVLVQAEIVAAGEATAPFLVELRRARHDD
jgi:hypothetical protein